MLHDAAGEQVDLIGLAGRVEIEVRVDIVIVLLLVVHQRGKHQAGLHVVTVDDVVLRGEVRVAAPIQEHGAILVVISVDIAVEVILTALVGGLHDGVLQHGVGTVYIAHHVGVLRLHLVEVHGNALRIGLLGLLVLL